MFVAIVMNSKNDYVQQEQWTLQQDHWYGTGIDEFVNLDRSGAELDKRV